MARGSHKGRILAAGAFGGIPFAALAGAEGALSALGGLAFRTFTASDPFTRAAWRA